MKFRALKKATVTTALVLLLPQMAAASDINAQALKLAGDKKFDQALAVLSQQDSNLANGYEHRFLKARILSWACLLYTSPSPRDQRGSRMPSSA